MRVIKPLRLSVLQRVLTIRRSHHLSVGLLMFFPLDAPEVPLPEASMWQRVTPALGKDGLLDEGMPKPRGEVLVFGKAFSPGGEPRPAFAAGLTVGPADKPLVDKTIAVVGKRRWHHGTPTEPEPITEMPLVWEHAFGGPDYPLNPKGMGLGAIEEEGARVHYLPHLEDPRHLLKSPGDRPPPACFGALDPTLASRIAKLGTYGAEWLQHDFPGYARDLDPEYFQVAPEDQRLPDYFQGGEPISLTHLHPTRPQLGTRAPTLRARCFVRQRGAEDADGEEGLREVATRLETVILFPDLERGVAIFRGVVQVAEDDADDVRLLIAGLERADAPKPVEHYRAVMARRLDKDKGHLHALNDKELLPEAEPGAPSFPDEAISDMDELIRRERALEQRSFTRAQRELDQARLTLRMLGMNPDEKLPREIKRPEDPKPDELAELAERMDLEAAELQKQADAQRRDAEDEARKLCAEQGLDFDKVLAKSKREGGGPSRFSADEELARLRELAEAGRKAGAPMDDLEAKLADPEFAASLRRTEERVLGAYRAFAHLYPPTEPAEEPKKSDLRAEVERALAAGESLARRDLTGADLHGLGLAGADLREALLEGADLSGCDLGGADLTGAVLTRARLEGARLGKATLRGANLGEARAARASFEGVDLRGAVLHKAWLEEARLSGADLAGADFLEARVRGADFSGAAADDVLFFQLDLTGARFAGASLRKATFFQCAGAGADFGEADLEDAALVEFKGEKASFRKAKATALRVVSASALPGADFSGAELSRANLRGVDLEGAILEGASADGADFSEANLRKARLAQISGKGARFMRSDLAEADLTGANLMDAMLQKAKVPGARFENTNLFRANLLDAKGDPRTSFSDAHIKHVVFTGQGK
ncbi:hypothetical protein BE20_32030 [Sorangium cellulosum]|uniref:DUF2169 domain-containing protein n=1 Tax=Sorangium cellulosum TaxID=56 RepID=A0A150T3S3_SORCE|nr:hypothetical protein BE18_30145 [Sorangium cellulosum]KYF99289.1 hypothetical protein BE20_32030 [Sorangium cellulosum]